MVLDAGTGQNALAQLEHFRNAVDVTGLALTKLDGTAKGGVLIALAQKSGLPIRYIGVGDGIDDLQPFDPEAYVDALIPEEQLTKAADAIPARHRPRQRIAGPKGQAPAEPPSKRPRAKDRSSSSREPKDQGISCIREAFRRAASKPVIASPEGPKCLVPAEHASRRPCAGGRSSRFCDPKSQGAFCVRRGARMRGIEARHCEARRAEAISSRRQSLAEARPGVRP